MPETDPLKPLGLMSNIQETLDALKEKLMRLGLFLLHHLAIHPAAGTKARLKRKAVNAIHLSPEQASKQVGGMTLTRQGHLTRTVTPEQVAATREALGYQQ